MIKLKDKQDILIKHLYNGESIRSISRSTGISRRIISKYINQYLDAKKSIIDLKNKENIEEFVECMVEPPAYKSSNRQKRKLTPEIIEEVEKCLEKNEQKKDLGQYKQIMKKIDIYEFLIENDYDIGYTTITNLVNKLRNKKKEAFIKQTYNAGEVCEFDWGEAKLFINNKLKTLQIAIFTSAYSNYRFAILFTKQNTQSFQQAHALFFEHLGVVYKLLTYDNMRVVVKKFVGLTEKEATEGLLKLSLYYGFDFRFCNIAKGNEKGHVERSVEYIRRKAFSIKDHFNSLDEANQYLAHVCVKLNNIPKKQNNNQTNKDLLICEKQNMHTTLPKFECADIKECRVDKYSTITIDTCHYSVPDDYVGKIINVRVYPEKIVCYFDDKKLCEHEKKTGLFEWSLDISHYFRTLIKKPGALPGSLAFKQMNNELQKIYEKYYKENSKDFIFLIKYISEQQKPINEIKQAITKLEMISPLDISTDKIKLLCNRKTNEIKDKKESDIEKKSLHLLSVISSIMSGDQNWENKGGLL